MQLSLSIPNLFARLTHAYSALERECHCRDSRASDWRIGSQRAIRREAFDDLEGLSMVDCRSADSTGCDDLDYLALGVLNESPRRHRDSLSELSLSD